jgi:hypothetical protein
MGNALNDFGEQLMHRLNNGYRSRVHANILTKANNPAIGRFADSGTGAAE